MTDLQELVTLIDQYYDALTQYAFLDSKEERDNNPYLIEIINYIMLNSSIEHTITTKFHGQLTPYEYVVKMREMLSDSCEVTRESVIPLINVDDGYDNDDVDSWTTIDDDEYETQRKEEIHMIREYYNTLVELFTMV